MGTTERTRSIPRRPGLPHNPTAPQPHSPAPGEPAGPTPSGALLHTARGLSPALAAGLRMGVTSQARHFHPTRYLHAVPQDPTMALGVHAVSSISQMRTLSRKGVELLAPAAPLRRDGSRARAPISSAGLVSLLQPPPETSAGIRVREPPRAFPSLVLEFSPSSSSPSFPLPWREALLSSVAGGWC